MKSENRGKMLVIEKEFSDRAPVIYFYKENSKTKFLDLLQATNFKLIWALN